MSGVTVQQMAPALDSGPILTRQSCPIEPRETYATLHDKLAQMGAKLLITTLLSPLKPIAQAEGSATYCRKLTRADGLVDPHSMTAQDIDRRVRALNPWPGVSWGSNKILRAELAPHSDGLTVTCKGETQLFVTRIQPSGGKPMAGVEFARGHHSLP